ncbi:MAG: DUF302 domain-containing protein [Desulfobulbaceae bacterium]|nr:DUF302 domain-containing protein [Desulfobulbaceae bacterium]
MPKMMIVTHQSRFSDVDQTVSALKEAIVKEGWRSPGVRDISGTINKEGLAFDKPIRIVELCKAEHAKNVLTTNPEMSTLMPCAWGVYKGQDGKVYISGMNMGLMGRIFGGNISKVMSGHVAIEEARMLKEVVKE